METLSPPVLLLESEFEGKGRGAGTCKGKEKIASVKGWQEIAISAIAMSEKTFKSLRTFQVKMGRVFLSAA